MSTNQESDFEALHYRFSQILEGRPVAKFTALSTLQMARQAGEAEVRSNRHDLGSIRYADMMMTMCRLLLNADERGEVEPPLYEREKKHLLDRMDILSIMTEPNTLHDPKSPTEL